MSACAERGVGLCFLSAHGRFLSRISGPVQGNVLLRTTQYRIASSSEALSIAKMFLTGKIYNSRWLLEHYCRDHEARLNVPLIRASIEQMKNALRQISEVSRPDELLGIEGSAAKAYFSVFPQLILRNSSDFPFKGRNRRPPLDPVNALLFRLPIRFSAMKSPVLWRESALTPLLAFFPYASSRSFFSCTRSFRGTSGAARRPLCPFSNNLRSLTGKDFEQKENGAYYLKDSARRTFLAAWQKRKQETLTHPYLKEKISWGLIPHVQAMLLARFLRGDLDAYPPFLWK